MNNEKNDKLYFAPEEFNALKEKEIQFINRNFNRPKQKNDKDREMTGLSLSGGGIRSAIFNLGVLQAIAKTGLLQKIDYLSTVSGGGYIGSSLTWFLSEQVQQDFSEHYPDQKNAQGNDTIFGTGKNNFPYGTDEPGHFVTGENSILQHNLIEYLRRRGNYLTPGNNYTLLTLLAVTLRTGMLSLMTWVPLISLILWLLLLIGKIISSTEYPVPIVFQFIGSLGLLSIVGFVASGTISAINISTKTKQGKDDESFKCRSRADKIASKLLNFAILSIGIYLIAWFGTAGYRMTLFSIISGSFAGLVVVLKPGSQIINNIILPIASGLLAFGILLGAYQLAYLAINGHKITFIGSSFYWGYLLFIGITIALTLCVKTNLNDISIARFYRDRLKETFMPNAKSSKLNAPESFSKEAYLKEMCHRFDEKPYQGPYQIINANMILVDSKQKKYARRGGENFILSPLYCGSKATGWSKTSSYFKGELTLATSMAASGAAINPHSGAAGQGVTRNRMVSFIIGILNLRLGVWYPNPNPEIKSWQYFYTGNFLQTAWYGIKSWLGYQGYYEKAPCIQLSDGGHFENLGVYELIRRELKLIIISDASADPTFTFADFRNALRLAEADLNVEISLDDQEKLSKLMPNEGERMGLPMAEAQKGYLSGTIRYKNNKEGRFIYLKSTMIGGQRIRTKSYKLEYPRFPDQPTSDQFFDESQFSSYRDLGYTIACDMLENSDLAPLENRKNRERRSDIERRRSHITYTKSNMRKHNRRNEKRRAA